MLLFISRCFSHTLQLSVKDGLRGDKRCFHSVNKASSIVSHVRKSQPSSELLADYNKLKAMLPCRWNSKLKMIRSVLDIPPTVLSSVPSVQKLDKHDVDVLEEFVNIMSPLEQATDITQGDNYVTASMVIPTVLGLRKHLSALHLRHCNALVKSLLESVNPRCGQYLVSSEYRISAALDPRFKLKWCTRSEATTIADQHIDLCPETTTDDPASENSRKRPRLSLFAFMDATPSHTDSASEVATYLTEPVIDFSNDPLIFKNDDICMCVCVCNVNNTNKFALDTFSIFYEGYFSDLLMDSAP